MPIIVPAIHIPATHVDSPAQAYPASAYVVCAMPRRDVCSEYTGMLSDPIQMPFKKYAEKQLGYPVQVTGLQYHPYNTTLVIYVREDTTNDKD